MWSFFWCKCFLALRCPVCKIPSRLYTNFTPCMVLPTCLPNNTQFCISLNTSLGKQTKSCTTVTTGCALRWPVKRLQLKGGWVLCLLMTYLLIPTGSINTFSSMNALQSFSQCTSYFSFYLPFIIKGMLWVRPSNRPQHLTSRVYIGSNNKKTYVLQVKAADVI